MKTNTSKPIPYFYTKIMKNRAHHPVNKRCVVVWHITQSTKYENNRTHNIVSMVCVLLSTIFTYSICLRIFHQMNMKKEKMNMKKMNFEKKKTKDLYILKHIWFLPKRRISDVCVAPLYVFYRYI